VERITKTFLINNIVVSQDILCRWLGKSQSIAQLREPGSGLGLKMAEIWLWYAMEIPPGPAVN
jgi:hypothetical protein